LNSTFIRWTYRHFRDFLPIPWTDFDNGRKSNTTLDDVSLTNKLRNPSATIGKNRVNSPKWQAQT
jgi:hypothetical protein